MKLNESLQRRKRLLLLLLAVLAFTIRAGWAYRDYSANGTRNWADSMLYLRNGESFARGDFYPESSQATPFMIVGPAIPGLVALAKIVTGDPITPVLALNCLYGALLVFVLFALGKRLVSPLAGYILALWGMFNFAFIDLSGQILKEPLIILLLPAITLCLVDMWQQRKAMINLVISSLLFSLLIHADERYVVYGPFLLLFFLIFLPKKRKIRFSVLWLGLLLLTMVPWTVRNYNQFKEIVILTPRTTTFTSRIWGTDIAAMHFASEENIQHSLQNKYQIAEKIGSQYGVQPRRYGETEKYFKAFVHYWKPTYFGLTFIQYGFRGVRWSLFHNLNSILFYGLWLPFFVNGLILAILRQKWIMVWLGSLPVIHSLVHTYMIWPLERYRLPMNFLVSLLALWFMQQLWKNHHHCVAMWLRNNPSKTVLL